MGDAQKKSSIHRISGVALQEFMWKRDLSADEKLRATCEAIVRADEWGSGRIPSHLGPRACSGSRPDRRRVTGPIGIATGVHIRRLQSSDWSVEHVPK